MTDRINELISRYLDGTLPPEHLAELTEWIESAPANADEFAQAVLLDNRLHAEVNAAPFKDARAECSAPASAGTVVRAKTSMPRFLIPALAAAILIAVSIGIWRTEPNEQAIETTRRTGLPSRPIPAAESNFATIAHVLDAESNDTSQFNVGDRLGKQTIVLQSGFVSLVFDDGVEVTLQGPARYELLGPANTKLETGLLTATVPPGAEGFTVDTPTVEVVDLGTSFGIDLREVGFSNVSVFDGEVEVAVRDSLEKRLLTEGQSVRVGSDQRIEEANLNPERFEKVWPVASGIVGSSETFRFVPPWPRKLRMVNSDDDIFVAAEGRGVSLLEELAVNISEPGDYTRVDDLTPFTISGGKRIRSYVLHFMPESQQRRRRAKRIAGSITFDRPVVGLITQHEELLASSRKRFTRRSAGEAQYRRQLDLTPNGDRISLSEDRRTITVDLISAGRSSDLVRVIVDGDHRRRNGM